MLVDRHKFEIFNNVIGTGLHCTDARLDSDTELRLCLMFFLRRSSVLERPCLGEAASVINRDDPAREPLNF